LEGRGGSHNFVGANRNFGVGSCIRGPDSDGQGKIIF